jgi:hypothetical protein
MGEHFKHFMSPIQTKPLKRVVPAVEPKITKNKSSGMGIARLLVKTRELYPFYPPLEPLSRRDAPGAGCRRIFLHCTQCVAPGWASCIHVRTAVSPDLSDRPARRPTPPGEYNLPARSLCALSVSAVSEPDLSAQRHGRNPWHGPNVSRRRAWCPSRRRRPSSCWDQRAALGNRQSRGSVCINPWGARHL